MKQIGGRVGTGLSTVYLFIFWVLSHANVFLPPPTQFPNFCLKKKKKEEEEFEWVYNVTRSH